MESIIFSLDGRTDLINKIIDKSNNWTLKEKTTIGDANKQKFSDGELCIDYVESVRGKRVYLLSSPNTSDEIMKLMLSIDAAKRGGASEIIPILPYFPYARQDKKDQSRGPIGAKVIANMLTGAGATGLITFDLHADQIQGFFDIPITHIEGKNVFDGDVSLLFSKDMVLCGPDAGSGKRVKRMQKQLSQRHALSVNYVMMDKTRSKANQIDEMIIIGDVKGKDVVIVDDMCDTAGTLCKAAEVLINNGANSVRAVISHGVFSGTAIERIGESVLTEVLVSDSLNMPDPMVLCSKDYSEERCLNIINGSKKLKIVSLGKQIAMAVASINNNMSYEALKSVQTN